MAGIEREGASGFNHGWKDFAKQDMRGKTKTGRDELVVVCYHKKFTRSEETSSTE